MNLLINPPKQSGVALILVMLIIFLATMLVAEFLDRNKLLVSMTTESIIKLQADEFLLTTEALATGFLIKDLQEDKDKGKPNDDCGEDWAEAVYDVPIETGVSISGTIQDLQGRFNLNSVVKKDSNGQYVQAPEMVKVLTALINEKIDDALMAQTIAEEFADWVDTDIDQQGLYGREDPDYIDYRTANVPVSHVSELRLLLGLDSETYEKLMVDPENHPRFKVDIESVDFSVLPPEINQINVNTAPAAVLAALTGIEAKSLPGAPKGGFETIMEFLDSPELKNNLSSERINELKDYLTVQSEYFQISSLVSWQLGDESKQFSMRSRVYRPDNQNPPLVFYRELKPAGSMLLPIECNYGRS